MLLTIQIVSWLLYFPLKILGISALLRVGVRRYPLIFAYMVVTLLVAAVQAPFSLKYTLRLDRAAGEWAEKVGYVGYSIAYILILWVVVTFIYRASARNAARRMVCAVVIGGAILLVVGSFLLHYRPSARSMVFWMTPWTRDLHFGAAILDLAAWGMLVASPGRDTRALLLTGGMGIMFAGEAVGAALRSIAIPYRSYVIFYSGHILQVLADAAFLYIWWQAFRSEAREREASVRAATNGK